MKKSFLLLLLISITSISFLSPIIDSSFTFEESIKGTKAPREVIDNLVLLDVMYYSFDNKLHKGQIVVHKDVEDDTKKVFALLLKERFPIEKCIPIVQFNWSDDLSMEANNSSAFNYRKIAGTDRMSKHSFGKAIDLNPMQNPVIYSDGRVSPKGGKYDLKMRGTLKSDSPVVMEFKRLGWRWGGEFNSFKDYHHFDKD